MGCVCLPYLYDALMANVGKPQGITINGPVLRAIREARGLTVRAAAAKAGISGPTWSQYEGGTRAASKAAFDGLCKALELRDPRALRVDTMAEVAAEMERNRERRNKPVAA